MSSYLRVLRHQDFRYLFLAQAASQVGDRVVIVALALFITQRTGSATDLSLVLGAQAFVSPRVTPWDLGQGLLVGVLIGVLGGLYPAWRAAHVSPAHVLAQS